MTILIACEGVLRTPVGAPIQEGITLYRAMCAVSRVVLCLDTPLPNVDRWLRDRGLTQHDHAMDSSVGYAGVDLRMRQIDIERVNGNIDLLIEPNPDRAATALQKGVTTLLFLPPKYMRPEFRPDLGRRVKPWAVIAAELEAQKEIERDSRLGIE